MNTLFTFILGVLVGWLAEWLIDFFYWRKRYAEQNATQAGNQPLRGDLHEESNTVAAPDNLKVIKGIGVVIERKLNDAGIYTFEQLGDLTTSELRQVLGNVIERLADEDALLKQARELARGKE